MTKLQMAEFIVSAIENGWLPLYLPEIVTGNAEQALVALMGHEEMAQFIVDTVNNGMLTKENLGISD